MILSTIRSKLSSMPPNFRKIGQFILDHEQNVAFSSIYVISEAIGVSNASLVRFAKGLGFSGYQDLKRGVQEEIRHRLSPIEKIALSELDLLPEEKRLQKLFQNEINNLHNTFDGIRPVDLQEMVRAICDADRIFVCGFGVTRHMVNAFTYSITSNLNKEVTVISGSVSDYAPLLKFFKKGDAMFIMTFPPYSNEVKHVASVVKERGGTLCLFTDSAACPVYPLADTIIRCDTNSLLLANSYVGLIAVLNILVHLVFLCSKDASIEGTGQTMAMQERGYASISGNEDIT